MENSNNNLPKINENEALNREDMDLIQKNEDSENKSEVYIVGKKDDDEISDSFEYVKDDDEEQMVMEKIGKKNNDLDLLDHLITGEYFLNKKFLKKKRKQYGVVREKELPINDYYKLKYFQKLEEIDDKKRHLNQKNKNYKLEYYHLLEINDKKNERISMLEKQVDNFKKMLEESEKKCSELKKENNKFAVDIGDLELRNAENESNYRREKKDILKKAKIKCPICYRTFYKGDTAFLSCGHFTCKTCFPKLLFKEHGRACAICNKEGVWKVSVPHYDDDVNSEDLGL